MVLGLDGVGSQPGLTRPVVTLAFPPGGGADGTLSAVSEALTGLGGLGTGAATLSDGLIALTLRRGLVPTVDVAELLLTSVPAGPELPGPGDAGHIDLTAGDQRSAFTCSVELVEHRADRLARVTATNDGRLLAQSQAERSYTDQTCGAIIDDLARDAGVASTAGAAGQTLPRYVADGGRSVLEHIARLAATAGRLAAFDDAGNLALIDDTATGESVATFTAGETLLDYRTHRRTGAGTVMIDGAGASDAGGSNAWAWLRKEPGPVSVSSGAGLPQHRRTAPWVRTPQAATDFASAYLRGQERAATLGRFLLPAAPAIVPGAIFTIAGTDTADGTWLALAVTLRFDREQGMISEVHAAPPGAGTDLPLGLPGGLGGL